MIQKLSPEHIAIEERNNNAVELRKAGATFQQIADQLGYAHRGKAHEAITQVLKKAAREVGAELLELELQRLDRLQIAHWQSAVNGDGKATDRVLRIMERRAKLLGLDSAIKIEADIHHFDTREELLAQAERLLTDADTRTTSEL